MIFPLYVSWHAWNTSTGDNIKLISVMHPTPQKHNIYSNIHEIRFISSWVFLTIVTAIHPCPRMDRDEYGRPDDADVVRKDWPADQHRTGNDSCTVNLCQCEHVIGIFFACFLQNNIWYLNWYLTSKMNMFQGTSRLDIRFWDTFFRWLLHPRRKWPHGRPHRWCSNACPFFSWQRNPWYPGRKFRYT